MAKPSETKKSRMVRIVVSDEVWEDFKALNRNRYASNVLGRLVEREVVKGRRTSLDLNKSVVERAIADARASVAELQRLVERLEPLAGEEDEPDKWWEKA